MLHSTSSAAKKIIRCFGMTGDKYPSLKEIKYIVKGNIECMDIQALIVGIRSRYYNKMIVYC